MASSPFSYTHVSPSALFPMNYTLRQPVPSDLPYIRDTWLKSYEGSGYAKLMPKFIYRSIQCEKITTVINRATLKVATLPDDDELVVAWSCTEGDVIHYVYVREAFRQKGIAKWILGDPRKYRFYTHKSRILPQIHMPRGLICIPDLADNPKLVKGINDESLARFIGKPRYPGDSDSGVYGAHASPRASQDTRRGP